MQRFFGALILLILINSCQQQVDTSNTIDQPNILLLVADDLGYADLGCFGSDIQTPNIDALAAAGVRFSSFHTAVMCAPTRAMLLSGNDNHIAGTGSQFVTSNAFGYERVLTNRVITIPELLQTAGYHTYMAGKWHLGTDPEDNPYQKGFERSYVLLPGAGNHYTNQSALGDDLSEYTEDGKPTTWNDGDYSTDFYTDKLIEYIESNKDDGQPFFAFAAYTAPHWPLQVDESYSKKYEGQYNAGYDILKAQRLNSLKESGIIDKNAVLPLNLENFKPWDSLSLEDKKFEARKMELYAGMVDNLDHNIGRLITYLKEIGEYENTLIVFMSDNGAAHRDFYNNEDFAALRDYYNEDYENMGKANSYISYGPAWAEAGSSPFRYYKDYATQGGMNTPMIISGSQVLRNNEIHHGFVTLMDLAPTFYDMARVEYPNTFKGNKVYPLKGSSLLSFVKKEADKVHSEDYVFAHEHSENAMVRKGHWKITNVIKPFQMDNFELFNLSTDLAEQYNVKDQYPEKYEELLQEWKRYMAEVKLQFPPPESNAD